MYVNILKRKISINTFVGNAFFSRDMKKQKLFKSFQNIKRKYFKSNIQQPNFLTYFEKQQIKNLHEKSPKEWTPETLSTCFPASPETICVSYFKCFFFKINILFIFQT